MELTENERKTYEYVRDCLQGEGYPPRYARYAHTAASDLPLLPTAL